MRDILWKLKVLIRVFLPDSIRQWRCEVWSRDPDLPYCCDGRDCGCYAMTTREVFDPKAADAAERGE